MPVAVYRFGDFSLHCGRFELSRDGKRLKLERKPLELLVLLVTRHGQIVTREEIAQRLWNQDVFVDIEHGINTAIRKIRQTLDDSTDQPQFVQTISGSGYRFIADVTAVESDAIQAPISADPVAVEVSAAELVPALSQTRLPEALPAPAARRERKPRRRLWQAAAVVAAGVVVVAAVAISPLARYFHRNRRVAIGSIAVLPLQNLSGDPGQAFFADGMTDELITELARIPDLRVVSRTSVMAYRDPGRPLTDIARQLGVDAIVEGSIVRSGNRIRLTAQLIDGRTDRHLWAQSFEGPASDILALQDSFAQQIATQARHVLDVSPPRPSIDPAAEDAYLRGRYFFQKQDFPHSLEYYKKAVALDPNYSSAQAGYAAALIGATTFAMGTPNQLMPVARAAAQRAIALDSRNGQAYTSLGTVQTLYEYDWKAAEQNLTRGISLNPSDSLAQFMYAEYLDAVGRPQDALTHMRRALELDPSSYLINLRLSVDLYYDRQYDAALAQLQRAAEMEPQSNSLQYRLTLFYEQKGDRDQAVQHDVVALHGSYPGLDGAALLAVYQRHGWEPYWRARTRALRPFATEPCISYQIGVDDLRVHEVDDAFASLERALDNHCFSMAFARVDPLLDPVRQDPRFTALLQRMHQ